MPSQHPHATTLHLLEDVIRVRAAATPDAVAVLTPAGPTTFADLDRESSQVAQALMSAGAAPGDRVAFVGENTPAFLSILFGCAKAGAILTAMNNRLAPPEVDYILADAQPTIVFVGAGSEHLVENARNLGARHVIPVASTDAPGAHDFVGWLSEAEAIDPHLRRDPEATALMFYSSGTTGRPKGIELTGANLAHALTQLTDELLLDATSVAFAPLPFFHVAGLGLALASVWRGATLLMKSPAGLDELLDLLQQHRVTHTVAVPTLLQFLLAVPGIGERDWSALRVMIYGASSMPLPVLLEATEVFGCGFVQSYGLTESTGGVTALTVDDHRAAAQHPERLLSVGRPLPSVELRIVDPDTMQDVALGGRGEVWIRGPLVMARYWRNPRATEEALVDGWLRTCDVGSLDADGYLYLHDRLKDMIISGGENVYPAEVESVMTGHPGVAHVAVIGAHSERWGQTPVAFVVPQPGVIVEEPELLGWTRERLASYKCPTEVTFVQQLPMTASGKVQKNVLRERRQADLDRLR